MKKTRLPIAAVLAGIAVVLAPASAQEPVDEAAIAAIRTEGMERSEVSATFYSLTDVLGPRLTGSPAHGEAARWARDKFRDWGLANPRLEAFDFGRGWSLEKLTTEMTAPRYMPLTGYAEAWSPPTSGLLAGTPIYLGDSSIEEIDRLGRRLRGAIVLTHRPQTEFLDTDRPTGTRRRTGADRQPALSEPG